METNLCLQSVFFIEPLMDKTDLDKHSWSAKNAAEEYKIGMERTSSASWGPTAWGHTLEAGDFSTYSFYHQLDKVDGLPSDLGLLERVQSCVAILSSMPNIERIGNHYWRLRKEGT